MGRFGVAMVVMIAAGSSLSGQKITSVHEFDQAMKTIAASFRETDRHISSSAYRDAKIPLSLTRQVVASTLPFWLARNKEDAVKLVRRALEKLDELDVVLSRDTVDADGARLAMNEVTNSCATCHVVYREGDPSAGYRIKRESR